MNVDTSLIDELSDAQRRALLRKLLRKLRQQRAETTSPLSNGQRGLWFIYQLDPDSAAYNMGLPARIDSTVDVAALRRAFVALAERHPMLRTIFTQENGVPRQKTPDRWAHLLHFEEHNVSLWDEQALRAEVERTYRKPFDLERGPILRVDLFTARPESHVLLFGVHHITADAWSFRILLDELGTLYEAECSGKPVRLGALPWAPRDHVAWQDTLLQGAQGEALWKRWQHRLHGNLPAIDLPTDRPRPSTQVFRGDSVTFLLERDLTESLKQLAKARGSTMFVVLLSAFYVLLHRYTRQADLLLGTPMAGRSRRELERMVGYFVNLVVLRVQVAPALRFCDFLQQVRQVTLDAIDDQDLPFDMLIERLQPERDPSRSPLVQVLFEYQKGQRDDELVWLTVSEDTDERVDFGGLQRVGYFPLRQQEGKFDLQLEMAERPQGLAGVWKYSSVLFDAETIERMTEHLRVLLRCIVADPGCAIGRLSLLSEGEHHRLMQWGQAQPAPAASRTLHGWFEARVDEAPDAVAVIDGLDLLTYGELNQQANQLARHLRQHGVGEGQRVGLCVSRSADIIRGQLAILKAGGAYVPMDPALPPERLAFLIQDAGTAVVLTQEALRERLSGAARTVLCLDEAGAAWKQQPGDDLAIYPSVESLAYIIYTSGSTGRPKGVMVSHANVTRLFLATEDSFGFGSSDIWALFHSYAFDFSVWEIWGALLHGGQLVIVPPEATKSPEVFHALICSEGVTVLNQTPSAFRQLVHADELAGPGAKLSLRLVIFGGEALDPGMLRPWFERHGDRSPQLVNMYGITETCVHVTYRPLSMQDVENAPCSPIGRAIGDLSLYVLDAYMQHVPIGIPGELYIGGAGVAHGYLGRPGLTARCFVPDPFSADPGRRLYRSGDLARLLPSGEVEYLGRIDNQVKVRGFRIELGEIEHALREHEAVREVAVLARKIEDDDQRLVAYVVPLRDVATSGLADTLQQTVAAKLPSYMVPSAFVFMEELPINHNGKLDREALPEPSSQIESASIHVPPETEMERRLAEIWADVLRVERVGRTDLFFHIGGHSLLATRLVTRVREELAIDLPILAIFETPMLADFARRVEEARGQSRSAKYPPIEKLDRSNVLGLGLAQRRLWFLDQLDRDNPVYNVPILLRITGALDRVVLARSIETIAARHEILRTVFPVVSGEPVQSIAPPSKYDLPVIDLREQPAEVREAQALAIASDAFHRSFDLAHGPLWRGVLVMLDTSHHWLVLTVHHIVMDGWSVNIYLDELKHLYRDFVTGGEPSLAELPIQCADFAAWQQRWLQDGIIDAQLGYWKEQLAGAAPVLELPGDRPRPPVQSFNGALLPISLSPALSNAVRAFGREHGVTPFMTVLAVFQTLLYRCTGQDDIVVGSPIANRRVQEVESLIGCFVNNLVLRTRFHDGQTFGELVTQVRQTTLDAYEHQDIPFETLVDVLKPARDLSRNPMFQVMFALQNTPQDGQQVPGLTFEPVLPDSRIAKFDLTLSLVDTADTFTGYFEYNSDIFDEATVARFIDSFFVLLEGALTSPEAEVAKLPLLTESERHRLLVERNHTDMGLSEQATIPALFAAQAARTPDAVCLITESHTLAYAELDRRARQLARCLVDRGVGPDVCVGVCMERSADLPIAMLAVLMAGGAYVPLDPTYPKERIAFILEDTKVPVLLTQTQLRERMPVHDGEVLYIDEMALATEAALEGPAGCGVGADHLALVIYTSGSTGRPKGVAITHRSVDSLIAWSKQAFDDDELKGTLASTSVCFDLSVFELFVTLTRGGTVVLVNDLLSLASSRLVGHVRLINTVPSAMGELVRMRAVPTSARIINLAGEPIRQSLVDALYALDHVDKVFNLYGPSEDTVYSTFALLEAGAPKAPPIGIPIGNSQAYVLDAHMTPVPVGVIGELYLGGAGLARGYLERPALTAERFVPNPFGAPGSRLYRTGDIARWNANRQLDFLGRKDGQVKLRGFRIELGEIEEALSRHPGVQETAVVVRNDVPSDPRLVAYVATGKGRTCTASELRQHLHEIVPSYMEPSHFVIREELPHTPNGKIDKRALPAPEIARPDLEVVFAAPSTSVQQEMAQIWKDVLGVPEVGVDDNFFDLGGHSLLLTRVHGRVVERFDERVSLVDLFQYPTIRTLTDFLQQESAASMSAGRQGMERAEIRKQQRNRRRKPSSRV